MADTGWVIVGTGGQISPGKIWNSPSQITADDTLATQIQSIFDGDDTYQLKGSNVGLAIPGGDVIDGIEIRMNLWEAGAGTGTIEEVFLVDEGGVVGSTNRAGGETMSTSTANLDDYGGSTDLWGDTWSEADVEDVDFGFVCRQTHHGTGSTGHKCDYFAMKVYHSTPAAAGSLPFKPNPMQHMLVR